MGDITTIKRQLATRAQDVCEMLLPYGRREGSEWRAGSVHGEKGKSLGVHLTGAKAGTWKDFSQDGKGSGGDLLDLWCATTGVDLPEALDRAREYLGMERPKQHALRSPTKKFLAPKKPAMVVPKGRARDYMLEDRNIPEQSLAAYKIGETKSGSKIVFPFLKPDGSPALIKTRDPEDGGKTMPTSKECEPILFGWQTVGEMDRELYITEGEIDAVSLHAYGVKPAMSVPFGGGSGAKQQWIENDYDRLERFEKIYLVLDDDEQGDAAAEEIAQRLGRHRCVRVRLPRKDANQCLVEGVSGDDIRAALADAETMDPDGLRRVSDFTDEVIDLFFPPEGAHVGYQMPYSKPGMELYFRPGELTLWSGATGSGKSQILGDCCVDWVKQGARTCVASFEMAPRQTLRRMTRQATGIAEPSRDFIRQAMDWMDGGMMLFDCVGKRDVKSIIEVFEYARAKYGCDVFIVDSLMRLGVASDDYAGQEGAVFQLIDWTVSSGVHVHLVAHARKSESSATHVPTTEDVKGAMEIGANAFNVITVFRNKKCEELIASLRLKKLSPMPKEKSDLVEKNLEEAEAKPGVIVSVTKQRNGDWEGKLGLWFNQENYQYRDGQNREKRSYL